MREQMVKMARGLNVIGLMNTQFAVQGDTVYILEVNPRASRTVPFVSKATGVPLAKVSARCMVGISLPQQGITKERIPNYFNVKEAVFPFVKFPGVDPILGPEMKSTGEVMGVGATFGEAFSKSQLGAGATLPAGGKAFISVRDADKPSIAPIAKGLLELGFEIVATRATAKVITDAGYECDIVNKVKQGRPHIVDMIKNDEISLIINTIEGRQAIADSYTIRRAALQHKVAYTTTLAGGEAAWIAIKDKEKSMVLSLQEIHRDLNKENAA
jgi:carbamoyl-phosphate synthase large subunit